MKVKFRNAWFAPSGGYKRPGGDVMTGEYYPQGVHEVPDELAYSLPSSAEVDPTDDPRPKGKELSRHDWDLERAQGEALDRRTVVTEERRAQLASARLKAAEKRANRAPVNESGPEAPMDPTKPENPSEPYHADLVAETKFEDSVAGNLNKE